MKACIRCVVSGRVQGVFFRASAQQEAQRLGLTGWARNLPDGRVEVLVCGDGPRLDDFCGWLEKGPPEAHVEAVEREERPFDESLDAFGVR